MEASSQLAFRAQLVVPEQRDLYDYWLSCAKDRSIPSRDDIHPSHFPKLLPYISLIDVCPEEKRFRIRLAGTRLRDIYDREITGRYLDELDWGDKRDYWLSAYSRVARNARPAQGIVRGPRRSKDHIVQFWLRLPLSPDGEHVSMILCYDAFIPSANIQALGSNLNDVLAGRVAVAGYSFI